MNGAILALAWAYGVALVDLPADWATGLAWGAILTVLALLMTSSMRSAHPAVRRSDQEDPGPAATNFGAMTPVGNLMGHLVYGLVLALATPALTSWCRRATTRPFRGSPARRTRKFHAYLTEGDD